MINKFDATTCKTVQQDLLAAMEQVASKHSLSVRYEGGKYADLEFNVKLKFTIRETADGGSVERMLFDQMCGQYNVPASAYGQVIALQGKRLRLTGFALNRSKFCVRVVDLGTGKAMLYPEAVLKSVKAV